MSTTVKNNTKQKQQSATRTANRTANRQGRTAVATMKVVQKSKGQKKVEQRIKELEVIQSQRSLTTQELTWLENARIKLESRSISHVYKYLKNELPSERRKALLGKSTMPSFKEFAEKAPNKHLYSYWDGLRTLVKFNNAAKQQDRAVKQNKVTAKK